MSIGAKIETINGEITKVAVDAIVNAAAEQAARVPGSTASPVLS
jgi:O-acetyl-ADP-ribose deacetylase (regulator of RNase III)